MKRIITYVLYFAVIVFCWWMWSSTESGHERELLKLKKQHYYAMDSLNKRAEMWRKVALDYGNQYRKEATRAQKAEERFNYLREENNILKRRAAVRYSNSQLDSLLSARYDR